MNPNPNKRSFLHTAPAFALCGRDLTLYAIKPGRGIASEGTVLDYHINDGRTYTAKLATADICEFDEMTYTLLSVTIPASDMSVEGEVTYAFYEGGKKCGIYTVPIVKEGKLPPLMISEIYGRCKHKAMTHYLELSNPTAAAVDLYDYKLMTFSGEERAKRGDIMTWKVTLYVDGKEVDTLQSFLWE